MVSHPSKQSVVYLWLVDTFYFLIKRSINFLADKNF